MMQGSRIVGSSEEVQAVLRLVDLFALSPATVLVSGESGTGKELVAQALHSASARRDGPFIPVNCAAIPRDLLESELFGYRKGAFSGAVADRAGRFELANGGTILLDEIGDMSLDMQAKMLRVLQEGVVDPIGSNRPVRIDVRVVAATHRDLEAECAAGRFREDLFYRLNVLPITMPALRDRRSDIPELATFFAQKHAQPGHGPVTFDAHLLALLQAYDWPGNIRELSNLVNRLCVMLPGTRLSLETLPSQSLPKGLRALLADRPVRSPLAAGATCEPAPSLPADAACVDVEPCVALENGNAYLVQSAVEDVIAATHPKTGAGRADRQSGNLNRMFMGTPVEEMFLIAYGDREFPESGVFLKAQLADFEKRIIARALQRAAGNISRAAMLLNLQRTTLIQKLNKLRERDGFDRADLHDICAGDDRGAVDGPEEPSADNIDAPRVAPPAPALDKAPAPAAAMSASSYAAV